MTIFVIFSVFCSLSGRADEACGDHHHPELLLKKISCSSATKVLVVGEDHNDPVASMVKLHANLLSDNNFIFGFFEARNFTAEQTIGLEDPLIYAFSGVYVARAVLDEAIARHAILPAAVIERIKSDLTNGFKAINDAPEDLSNLESMQLLVVATSLSRKMLLTVAADPKYKFLNLDHDGGAVYGYGRSILFAKKVTENYCDAAAKKQNIWIQIGEGHADQVNCLLKNYLPEGADVKVVPASAFKDAYSTWKTASQGMLDEIKAYVVRKNRSAQLSIKTETDSNPKTFAIVRPFEISVGVLNQKNVDFKDLAEIVEKRGYKLVDVIDIDNEILQFTITFDITKTSR